MPYTTLRHTSVDAKRRVEMHVGVETGNPVIAFSGEIDLASAEGFLTALRPWVETGGPVTVDLSKVTFMDSTGIHAVIEAAEALGDRGCIIIHGAHDGIQKVFELTMLDSVPNVHIIPCTVLVEAV
jgi:anti-sigma B factor antagonist